MLQFTDADILVPLYAPPSERLEWDSKLPAPVNNTYIGQMKLLMSELAFLTMGCSTNVDESVIVYAGAAGGHHIPALASLFPETHFWLYDPSPFAIAATDKLHIVRGLFTDQIATKWSEHDREPVIFISDVRTSGDTREEHESEIVGNMEMQSRWVGLIQPQAWSLKFRISYQIIESGLTYRYLGGRIMYQPYPKPTSMELRLVGNRTAADKLIDYDSVALERTVFYHNMVVRPDRNRYLNVFTDDNTPYGNPDFDNGYDCSYMLHTMKRYLEGPGRVHLGDRVPESMSSPEGQELALTITKRLIESTSQGRWTLGSRKVPPRRK